MLLGLADEIELAQDPVVALEQREIERDALAHGALLEVLGHALPVGRVNYERRQPRLVVTVFVYPTSHGEPDADDEFAKAVRNAARAMGATRAESQPLTIRKEPQELSGHLALLSWQGSDVISWLALVPSGGWYYKAQATASLNRDGALAESASAAVVILQDAIFGAD